MKNAAGIRRPKKWETRMNRLVASWVSGCLLMIPIAGAVAAVAAGAADAGGPTRGGSQPDTTLETIVVTLSYIRRTATESPLPAAVIPPDHTLYRAMPD